MKLEYQGTSNGTHYDYIIILLCLLIDTAFVTLTTILKDVGV